MTVYLTLWRFDCALPVWIRFPTSDHSDSRTQSGQIEWMYVVSVEGDGMLFSAVVLTSPLPSFSVSLPVCVCVCMFLPFPLSPSVTVWSHPPPVAWQITYCVAMLWATKTAWPGMSPCSVALHKLEIWSTNGDPEKHHLIYFQNSHPAWHIWITVVSWEEILRTGGSTGHFYEVRKCIKSQTYSRFKCQYQYLSIKTIW